MIHTRIQFLIVKLLSVMMKQQQNPLKMLNLDLIQKYDLNDKEIDFLLKLESAIELFILENEDGDLAG